MPRIPLFALVALALLAAPVAHAGPGDEVRVVPHPDYTLNTAGAVPVDNEVYSLDNDYIPMPSCMGNDMPSMEHIDGNGGTPSGRQVVFLNFDGAVLTSGGNSSQNNKTMLLTVASHNYPAMNWSSFGGKDKGMAYAEAYRVITFGHRDADEEGGSDGDET